MPKLLELFCGTKCISNAFKKKGWEVYPIDWDTDFQTTLFDWADNTSLTYHEDIGTLTYNDVIKLCNGKPDVIWASPDCSTYSVASLFYHRKKNELTGICEPVTEYAKKCDKINNHVIELIKELDPKYFFIENPRACMRTMPFMQDLPRYTVTYCQYGDTRQKPTDIWTNHPNPNFKPMCKPKANCHESAPRGSKTGTQGLNGAKERGQIPKLLCEHIVNICQIK